MSTSGPEHDTNTRKTGLNHFIHAARWSWAGLLATFRHEAAFRQELALLLVLAPLAWWLGETGVERSMMLGSLILVLIVELLNSALESIVNRVGTEHHELSGRAKDQGSAAVLLSLLLAGIVWATILLG